jgi:hypothetical protein
MPRTSYSSLALALVASSFVALPAAAAPPATSPAPAKPVTADKPAASSTPARLPLDQALTGEAKAEYDSALVLYQDGDFASASLKFQRAHALSQDVRLLWNAAAAEKQLRRYARMYLLVSRYLREGETSLTAQEKSDGGELLRTVEQFVSHLTVNVNQPGAELFVDGVSIATLPTTEPLVADMGSRKFQVKKAGFKDFVVERDA